MTLEAALRNDIVLTYLLIVATALGVAGSGWGAASDLAPAASASGAPVAGSVGTSAVPSVAPASGASVAGWVGTPAVPSVAPAATAASTCTSARVPPCPAIPLRAPG